MRFIEKENKEGRFIRFRKDIVKRLLIVFLWITISLGIYQCNIGLNKIQEEPKKEQQPHKQEDTITVPIQQKNPEELQKQPAPLPLDETIRVLIMTEGFREIYHTELTISCKEGFYIDRDGHISEYDPDFIYTINTKQLENEEQIKIVGKNGGKLTIGNLNRNGESTYRGSFTCYHTPNGLVLVNELLVEEYLYGVVPSEMPSSYPTEALKAQAICARTYTYFHKQSYAYPQWQAHMDDSTSFQVYMNSGETPAACQAVDETKNMILTYNNNLVESFYYSTSSGNNGGAGVWKDIVTETDGYLIETGMKIYAENSTAGEAAYKAYIDNKNPEDIEYNESWYRWQYPKILNNGSAGVLLEKIYNLSLSQPQNIKIRSQYLSSDQLKNEGMIRDIRILNRRQSGLVTQIMIETEHFKISVNTQYTIRQIFGSEGDIVVKNDGNSSIMGQILPSAYFYIEKIYDNNGGIGDTLSQIIIHGAGLGHGCGMSQNGAKCLANKGFTAAQVLAYYYNGEITDVSEMLVDGL